MELVMRRLAVLIALAIFASAAGSPWRAATPAEQVERAVVVRADYRYDDILWENDRTAHRIYGHALEAAEPPSGSGIDAWGKTVGWPFMDRQLRTGDQHTDHGEGVDFYNVGGARGMGGLGVWSDNKLWTSRNYVRAKVLASGGKVADFTVDYAPWPVGVDRQVSEARRFTLPLGTSFTRMVSTIRSNRSDPLIVGIGIARRATDATRAGAFSGTRESGRFSWWGPDSAAHGAMGIGLIVDPAAIVGVAGDSDNHLVLVRVVPGRPFVYYAGATWSRGKHATSRAAWEREVAEAPADFAVPRD